jgi:hypothetical protein
MLHDVDACGDLRIKHHSCGKCHPRWEVLCEDPVVVVVVEVDGYDVWLV